MMRMVTIPVSSFQVVCWVNEDLNKEFDSSQFDDADRYLAEMRQEFPGYEFEMIAAVSA